MNAAVTESMLQLIESLTPTSGEAPFQRITEWPPSGDPPVVERLFSVEWDGEISRVFETGTRRYRESGVVVIHYEQSGDFIAVEKRMAEDRSLVLDSLSQAELDDSVVVVVPADGSRVDRSDPLLPIVHLRFTLDYRL